MLKTNFRFLLIDWIVLWDRCISFISFKLRIWKIVSTKWMLSSFVHLKKNVFLFLSLLFEISGANAWFNILFPMHFINVQHLTFNIWNLSMNFHSNELHYIIGHHINKFRSYTNNIINTNMYDDDLLRFTHLPRPKSNKNGLINERNETRRNKIKA